MATENAFRFRESKRVERRRGGNRELYGAKGDRGEGTSELNIIDQELDVEQGVTWREAIFSRDPFCSVGVVDPHLLEGLKEGAFVDPSGRTNEKDMTSRWVVIEARAWVEGRVGWLFQPGVAVSRAETNEGLLTSPKLLGIRLLNDLSLE